MKRMLVEMPFDKAFLMDNGNEELCHATGYEVCDEGDSEWWLEYQDSEGNLYYGR